MSLKSLGIISGKVVRFAGNGRKFGYPTANIRTATNLIDGIYFGFACMAEFSQNPALIFIGTPTTVGDADRRIEAHLLDIPDQNYYGNELCLEVRHFHRSNQTFDSIDELLKAMKTDEKSARQWFKEQK